MSGKIFEKIIFAADIFVVELVGKRVVVDDGVRGSELYIYMVSWKILKTNFFAAADVCD